MSTLISSVAFCQKHDITLVKFRQLKCQFGNFPEPVIKSMGQGSGKGRTHAQYDAGELKKFFEWHEAQKRERQRELSMRRPGCGYGPRDNFHNDDAVQFITGQFATKTERRRIEAAKRHAASVKPKTQRVRIIGD